jgi:lipoprotein-releasing system permease protein
LKLPYEGFIALRYLRSRRSSRFISFISIISIAGVALGVGVLIVVLSVMNGFEHELRTRILSLTAHATISGIDGPLGNWRAAQRRLMQQPGVVGAAPYVDDEAMALARGKSSGFMMRGILPEEEMRISRIRELSDGSIERLRPKGFGIVLGSELAHHLGVNVGDKVVVVIPQRRVTAAGVIPRMRSFYVVGTFSAGMYELDRNLAYVHMDDAALLFRLGNGVTGLRVQLADMFEAPRAVRALALSLGGGYYIDDWTRQHANFFRSIQLAKSTLFLILLLVVAVAAFNIISTLVMVVKDKQADIAILRTMGTSPRSVLAIFITQGTVIGAVGTLAGLLLGVLISNNLESLIHGLEAVLGTRFLDAKVYFMSDLPALVQWRDVAQICVIAFILCCLSTLYPAWRAARTEPARALRQE